MGMNQLNQSQIMKLQSTASNQVRRLRENHNELTPSQNKSNLNLKEFSYLKKGPMTKHSMPIDDQR